MGTSGHVLRHGPDIFVSYRRTDKDFVERLVPVLESLGPSVWWDAEIEGGEDWRDSIVENLAASRCLVIVFSEACNTSKQLKKELAVADHLDKDVIPLLIEATEPRGFFLYELAPLNWISIHPAPLEKLDSVARLLVARLEAAGWTALPMVAPSELAPPQSPVAADSVGADRSPAPDRPAVAAFAPPETADEAGMAGLTPAGSVADDHPEPGAAGARETILPPPSPPGAVPPIPTAGRALPTRTGPPRLGLRAVFPFRWFDFILPTLAGVVALLEPEEGGDVGVNIGDALFGFVVILAITGLILFPIRYYRRRSNPYRVARNLVISNGTFALVGSVAGFLTAESGLEEGETVNEARAYLALGFVLFGLLFAAISFVIFVLLSRLRARKTYQQGVARV